MTGAESALVAAAGFAAGAVNAVAGGGSLISFPALVATGLPTLSANVTNTIALWPGYAGTVAAYRPELAEQVDRLRPLGRSAAGGAVAGSVVLLAAPGSVFDAVVPFLVLAGSVLLAFQPRISLVVRSREVVGRDGRPWQLHAAVVAAGAYGAYFGGGLGVILLALLGIFVADGLQRLNGLKAAISLLVNSIAVLAFAAFGPVDWGAVAVVAPASLLGGFAGARLARRLAAEALRRTVVAFGVVVAAWLLVR